MASPKNKLAIISIFLWFGRYRITENSPEHVSATCFVYKAVDEKEIDSKGKPRKVCLKLMRYKKHFLTELNARLLDFDDNYVVCYITVIVIYFFYILLLYLQMNTINSISPKDDIDESPEDCYIGISKLDRFEYIYINNSLLLLLLSL